MPIGATRDLLAMAEDRYALKIFDNISREALDRMELSQRLDVISRAIMERTDHAGFLLGRKLRKCMLDQRDQTNAK